MGPTIINSANPSICIFCDRICSKINKLSSYDSVKYSKLKKIKEKCQPCSFEDLLSRNRPHLVHRVLQVGVASLLLVRDGAKNVDLKFEEFKFILCGWQQLQDTCSGFLKTTFLTWALPRRTWFFPNLKHHGTGHHVCWGLCCANRSCLPFSIM